MTEDCEICKKLKDLDLKHIQSGYVFGDHSFEHHVKEKKGSQ